MGRGKHLLSSNVFNAITILLPSLIPPVGLDRGRYREEERIVGMVSTEVLRNRLLRSWGFLRKLLRAWNDRGLGRRRREIRERSWDH